MVYGMSEKRVAAKRRLVGIGDADQPSAHNGLGIAAEHLPRIFEPMFTTKPFGEGMGLGLAIVHDIVIGEFGGTIDVASDPGRRTRFKLSFPLRA